MTLRWLATACLIVLTTCTSWADRRRDPLTDAEIVQLRDAAQDPETRIKLFIAFARTRMNTLDQVRSDPKTPDRAQKTHDALQDFLDIYDELDDNVDTFVARKVDLRKPMQAVIQADTDFQSRLRALKSAPDAHAPEASQYEFLLNTALDTLDTSAPDHRELLEEQEEAAKHKKK